MTYHLSPYTTHGPLLNNLYMDMFFFEWLKSISEIIEKITKLGINQSKLLLMLQNFTGWRVFINYMVQNIQNSSHGSSLGAMDPFRFRLIKCSWWLTFIFWDYSVGLWYQWCLLECRGAVFFGDMSTLWANRYWVKKCETWSLRPKSKCDVMQYFRKYKVVVIHTHISRSHMSTLGAINPKFNKTHSYKVISWFLFWNFSRDFL